MTGRNPLVSSASSNEKMWAMPWFRTRVSTATKRNRVIGVTSQCIRIPASTGRDWALTCGSTFPSSEERRKSLLKDRILWLLERSPFVVCGDQTGNHR